VHAAARKVCRRPFIDRVEQEAIENTKDKRRQQRYADQAALPRDLSKEKRSADAAPGEAGLPARLAAIRILLRHDAAGV
jgi:hypothetical protein